MKLHINIPECTECRSRLKSVFCELSRDEAGDITSEKSCSFYKKGQLIFSEGNRPLGLYCINKGKVKVFQIGEEGKEQILRLAKEGDILGYRALISGEVYSASASALEEAVICFIPKTKFYELIRSSSSLAEKLMQTLSHDLKEAEHRLVALAQKPVRERMAEMILTLKEFYGTTEDGNTINAQFSREEMANFVGTATETAIRILSDFKNEKLISFDGRKIKILNLQGLLKAAHIYD
ncbi:MAG: Crp/Fnr family transcriptional regulator [Ignavibacteria bacterium]|nr:Crp/Fnr family transcriptional regulator [Ignavibacteria bacterium]